MRKAYKILFEKFFFKLYIKFSVVETQDNFQNGVLFITV